MTNGNNHKRYITDLASLPSKYPTHLHSPEFWENLGRAIATFGFLEQTPGKAIFGITATTRYNENEIPKAYEKWLPTLQKALKKPLGSLIDIFGKSLEDNADSTLENPAELLADLRNASVIRNVLTHGSWPPPDQQGKSIPFFVNNQDMVFDTKVDIPYLIQTRDGTLELIAAVINTVTHMGYQFPGSNGPGEIIFNNKTPPAS